MLKTKRSATLGLAGRRSPPRRYSTSLQRHHPLAKGNERAHIHSLSEQQLTIAAETKFARKGVIALSALIMLIVLSASLSLVAVFMAPYFASSMLICIGLGVTFVFTERSRPKFGFGMTAWFASMHRSEEMENRFWSALAFFGASSVMFASDSPIPLGRHSPLIGVTLVVLFVGFVNYYDRRLVRWTLQQQQGKHLTRVPTSELVNSLSAKEAVQIINDCVDRLDYKIVALKTLHAGDISRQESIIVNTLYDSDAITLNYIITNVKLALLVYKVKDTDVLTPARKVVGTGTRSTILDLLCEKRLMDLDTRSRASVIDALQQMRLTAHPLSEQWVQNIFLSTYRGELTKLKTWTDGKGPANNLHKLLFTDIRSDVIRTSILNHIKQQATEFHMERKDYAERYKELGVVTDFLKPMRKIVSDVDDTLFSSGGHFPAGIDTTYGRHVCYPGVLTFFKELDLGCEERGVWPQSKAGNLVFLSARPHVYKDKSERKSFARFEALQSATGQTLHSMPTLLFGDLSGGLQMFKGDLEPIAQKKYVNFDEYAQLYPEYTFVFCGDNGQADVRTAELMRDTYNAAIEACFIHQVAPIHRTFGYSAAALEKWQHMHLCFFTTYVGAAVHALRMGLIHPFGLRRIALSCCAEFTSLKSSMQPNEREERRVEFNTDIESANAMLEELNIQRVPYLPAECLFHVGASVATAFGCGIIRDFRHDTGIYHVQLSDWHLSGASAVHSYVHGTRLTWRRAGLIGDAMWTPFGSGILEEIRESDGVHVVRIRQVSGTMVAYMQPVDLHLIKAAAGDRVRTPFGTGIMLSFRPDDHVYIVAVDWDGSQAMLYLNEDSLEKTAGPDTGVRTRGCEIM